MEYVLKAREEFTAEEVRRMLHYDPSTGVFTWKVRQGHPRKWNTRYANKPAGHRGRDGYLMIELRKGLPTKAARIAWLYMTGEWPKAIVDHRDRDRANDRWRNLRLASHSQNATNKGRQRNNGSGFVGVHFDAQRQRWRACVNRNRVRHDVGFFDTAETAAAARAAYVNRLHGEYAPSSVDGPRYPHHRDAADH